jgi:hypothetical protein
MPWQQVQLADPFTPDCLRSFLEEGARGTLSKYCHDAIISWAKHYADDLRPISHQPEHHAIWLLLEDMVACCELHIAGCYTLSDMKRFSRADMILPRRYFTTWLMHLETSE